MIGQRVKSPSGFEVVMGSNHHMAKPVMIGEVQADGQFIIVYQSKALPPKAWGPYVEANKGKVADWSWPWVCGSSSTGANAEGDGASPAARTRAPNWNHQVRNSRPPVRFTTA